MALGLDNIAQWVLDHPEYTKIKRKIPSIEYNDLINTPELQNFINKHMQGVKKYAGDQLEYMVRVRKDEKGNAHLYIWGEVTGSQNPELLDKAIIFDVPESLPANISELSGIVSYPLAKMYPKRAFYKSVDVSKILKDIPSFYISKTDIKLVASHLFQISGLKSFSNDLARIKVVTEEFGKKCETLHVQKRSDGTYKLAYNPDFIARMIVEDIIYASYMEPLKDPKSIPYSSFAYVIGHELLHYRFNHFDPDVMKAMKNSLTFRAPKNEKAWNHYADFVSVSTQMEVMNNLKMSEVLKTDVPDGGKTSSEHVLWISSALGDEDSMTLGMTVGPIKGFNGINHVAVATSNKRLPVAALPLLYHFPTWKEFLTAVNMGLSVETKTLLYRTPKFRVGQIVENPNEDEVFVITEYKIDPETGEESVNGVRIDPKKDKELIAKAERVSR